jgi:hypothetical protein
MWNKRMAANVCCRLVEEAVVVRKEAVVGVDGEITGREG